MATPTTEHYRTYSPRPFTREQRESTTILFGGLHWRIERVLQAVLENCGYRAQILPLATRDDLLTGREVADIGQCCPTSFTTGNLVNFLRGEARRIGAAEVDKRYVYMTAGSCGACRFGQYHQSYELALRNTGLEAFRMFLLAQDQMDQKGAHGDGLEIDLKFTLGALWGIFCTDLLQDLEYRVRPYEVVPGQTDEVVKDCVEHLCQVFRNRPPLDGWRAVTAHLLGRRYVRAMREVHSRFAAIEVDRLRVKPAVKITGEFYLQTVEGDPNYNIHRWLEAEGAEVYPAGITVWMDYLLRLGLQRFEDYRGIERTAVLKLGLGRAVQAVYRWSFDRLRRALGNLSHEIPHQLELRRLAAPYFHSRLDGGEGDMLVGKSLWAHLHHKAHMICELSPYSCMPNTMSIGAMAGVVGHYPDLLYAPLEIKGDAEVHALSRCQMILTEAKKRAQREFDEALAATKVTVDEARAYLDAHPEMKRATYRVPHLGAAGTAANMLMHVAGRMGRYRAPAKTAPTIVAETARPAANGAAAASGRPAEKGRPLTIAAKVNGRAGNGAAERSTPEVARAEGAAVNGPATNGSHEGAPNGLPVGTGGPGEAAR
jgi:predicted nucleotide-binding protein (sugar kinase/HSP70/actin superfamily)